MNCNPKYTTMIKPPYAKSSILWIFIFLTSLFACSDKQMKVSSFCESLEPVHRILEDPEWASWDMAPIYDVSGKVHLFVGRWPSDGDWLVNAQIVHAVSDSPEGPFEVLDTIFRNDTISYFNPQINKVGDIYVMVYAYKERSFPRMNQKIGLATATSFHQDLDGKFRIYYKTVSDLPDDPHLRTISLAIAENIEGPYVPHPDNPLISYVEDGLDVEDPYNFMYKGKYYMILEDRMDVASTYTDSPADPDTVPAGGWRPGLIYESEDGVNWEDPEIGVQTNAYYFDEPVIRFERAHILWKDGEPDYLFMALARNETELGTGAVLKINNWK
jgi:hypothetical protein